jgi:hypothetical protein
MKRETLNLRIGRPLAFFCFVVVSFYARLYFSNYDYWQFRDDSVIHLSHAKNLAEFGSIGLSPGDRTEAMSSPLNYILGQIWYFLRPETTYQSYLTSFTLLTLVLLALAYTVLVKTLIDSHLKSNCTIAWSISAIPVIFTVSSWTTFGWIVSGMENVLGSTLLILIAVAAVRGPTNPLPLPLIQILIFLAGIARIEFAALLLPIFISAIQKERSNERAFKIIGLRFAPIIICWLALHALRFYYFGQLAPNTAQALGKSIGVALIVFLFFQFFLLSPLIYQGANFLPIFRPIALIVWAFSGILILRNNSVNANFHSSISLLTAAALILIVLTAKKFSKYDILTRLLILTLVAPLNEYYLFGPARLSEFRIVAIFVPLVLTLGIFVIFREVEGKINLNKIIATLALIMTICSITIILTKADPERNLCCKINPSEEIILNEADDFKSINNFGSSVLPISASPDLGKISFAKKLIIVDLGLIGDPLLSRISSMNPERVSKYLQELATPDLIETHGTWSCRYSKFLNSEYFASNYSIAYQGKVSEEFDSQYSSDCPAGGVYTIWRRTLPQAEIDFVRNLERLEPSATSSFVKSEIAKCTSSTKPVFRCEYVYRGILRLSGKYLASGTLNEVVDSLVQSPTYTLDKIRLIKNRHWVSNGSSEFVSLID